MDRAATAERLTALLSLRNPPIALAFVDRPPNGIVHVSKPVPSACTFWRRAELGTFYASAEQHYNCPIGSMVMGFDLPATMSERLGGLVQSMCDARYLSMDEAAKVPDVGRNSVGIVYGPLCEFPLDPELVVIWVNVAQAMLYSEAAGRAAWTGAQMDITGRPSCAALPRALHSNQPGMSLHVGGVGVPITNGVDVGGVQSSVVVNIDGKALFHRICLRCFVGQNDVLDVHHDRNPSFLSSA